MTGSHAEAPVGRLAPSPTGSLHVGHARSFLCAWWSVRARGGRVVLRIEDLDARRVKPGMTAACLEDLEWLGLDWDGEPLLQSSEPEPMQAAVDALLAADRAYACTCSRKDIEAAASAPHVEQEGRGELRSPATCRDRYASPAAAADATGRPAGVRLKVPPGALELEDRFHGRFARDVQAEVGDFLIARRDGAFAYQLAVVVDDARQGVTEVLRGDDLLGSTPRQWLLQEALGLPHPEWIHVPLVVDDEGRRLAKRRGSLSLAELRATGVDARALVAWAARSAGMRVPARVTAVEATAAFVLEDVPHEPVVFGAGELRALGGAR